MQTRFTDVNTNSTIIIDSDATEHYSYNSDKTTIIISTLCAAIYNTILKKLIENNFKPITLAMKHDKPISIHAYSDIPATTLADCRLFEIVGGPKINMIDESLVKIASQIADWDKICLEHAFEVNSCIDFFLKHIKGHMPEEVNIGNNINAAMDEVKHIVEFDIDEFLTAYANMYKMTIEELKTCMNLAKDWDIYSTYYKNIYGVQPIFFIYEK